MNILTHLFLPLTVFYVLKDRSSKLRFYLPLLVFALFPDFDKVLGHQGLFHSVLILLPLGILFLEFEHLVRDSYAYSSTALAFLASHLILDIIDGGPVPLFYPLSETGIGFMYPLQIAFSDGPLGVTVHNPLLVVRLAQRNPGLHSHQLLTSCGISWLFAFFLVVLGNRKRFSQLVPAVIGSSIPIYLLQKHSTLVFIPFHTTIERVPVAGPFRNVHLLPRFLQRDPGFHSFTLITGCGVGWILVFVLFVLVRKLDRKN